MDVMSPDVIWLDGRCYRIPVIDPTFAGDDTFNDDDQQQEDWETIESKMCAEEEICSNEYFVESIDNGRYKMHVQISKTFWPFIVGAKGATKKRIENDTKTTINIPRQGQTGDVIITGSSKKNVILARKNLDVIIHSSRRKLTFTHFISIPINNNVIQKSFEKFKEQVLKLCGGDRGIEESIFQNPAKLHLTLGTLVLTDNAERKIAGEMLEEACSQIVQPLLTNKRPCMIEMAGIEYMNDDPSEVDVLYGRVRFKKDDYLLNQLADSVLQYFNEKGYSKKEDVQNVKLHVTLMNTLFREEKSEEILEEAELANRNRNAKKTRITFNATNVLKLFNDFYFGEQEFNSLHISVRFSTGADGYYQSSHVVNF